MNVAKKVILVVTFTILSVNFFLFVTTFDVVIVHQRKKFACNSQYWKSQLTSNNSYVIGLTIRKSLCIFYNVTGR